MAKDQALPTLDAFAPRASSDWRASLRQGHFVVFVLLGGFSAWASLVRLDGAAVAGGVVAVESNRKTVQHLEGGIVKAILVRDGDVVTEGQELLRLDPTRLDAQSALYRNQLAILAAQEVRLDSESQMRRVLVMPVEVAERASEASVAPVIADQNRLFQTHLDELDRNLAIADSEVAQARKDIEQNRIDLGTARATLANIGTELESLWPLYKRQLVAMSRITPLEREKLRLEGVIQGAELQATKLNDKLNEATLKRSQVEQDYRKDASTSLGDIRKMISDVRQNVVISDDGQKRGIIRAPIGGTVQEMQVFTIGGVIRAGDPILQIVPSKDDLVVQAKIRLDDVDRISPGMTAEIKFPAFNYWGRQAIEGTLRSLSRDRVVENEGKDAYFAAEVLVNKATLPSTISGKLMAGMTANVIISTEPRTVADYLLRPLLERFEESMRER